MSEKTDKIIQKIADSVGAATLGVGTILSKPPGWISTRCRAIDLILEGGRKGAWIPYGRIIEIAGLEHAGKTTLASHIMAEAQEVDDAICILADIEHTYDLKYADSLGVKTEDLIWLEADCMEELFMKLHETLDTIANLAPDRKVVIVWDSLGQTATKAERNVKIDPKTGLPKVPQMMSAAKCISENIRRINPILTEMSTSLIIINHIYQKPTFFGDPWESYGGQRLRYASSIRFQLMPSTSIKDKKGNVIGSMISVLLKKTKMTGNSGARIKVPLLHGVGFSDGWAIYTDAQKRNSVMESITVNRGHGTWDLGNGEELKFKGWKGFLEHVVPHDNYFDLVDEFYGEEWSEEDDD